MDIRGDGFTVQMPRGWQLARPPRAVVARRGRALVSVTAFPLVKAYDPTKFDAAARELDGVAAQLARQAGVPLSRRETVTVADRKIRAYTYGGRRIGFVLVGKREYQLFCRQAAAACDLLFGSFTLSGPQA